MDAIFGAPFAVHARRFLPDLVGNIESEEAELYSSKRSHASLSGLSRVRPTTRHLLQGHRSRAARCRLDTWIVPALPSMLANQLSDSFERKSRYHFQ